MNITVKSLTPSLLDDFLYFFDQVAFTDNPEWASCYCHYYHYGCTNKEWRKRSKEENRSSTRQLILSGEMQGYLAYIDSKPAGWCNANNKTKYDRLLAEKELLDSPAEKVGSIVCFLIAPGHRRKGLARQLFTEAMEGFKMKGYQYLEAYPRKKALTEAHHYHGTLSMYEKAGFTIYKELNDYYVVRKGL